VNVQLRLLLDTNVYVAAFISGMGAPAQLLRAAEAESYVLVMSPLLIDELTQVLARDKFRKYFSLDEARRAVDLLVSLAVVIEDPPDSDVAITDDPDDDYLVLLAEAANVTALVSGDPHLTNVRRPGLRILTPREALDLVTSFRQH